MDHMLYTKPPKKKRFKFIYCEICNQIDHFTRNCKNGIFNWLNIFGKNTFRILNYRNTDFKRVCAYKQKLSIQYLTKLWSPNRHDLNFKKNKKFFSFFLLNYIY